MKNIFTSKGNAKVCPNDIEVWYHKTTSYCGESLNILGPKIWNHQPSNIQSVTSSQKVRGILIHGFDLNVNAASAEWLILIVIISFFMYLLYTFYTMSNFIVYF